MKYIDDKCILETVKHFDHVYIQNLNQLKDL